LLGNIDAKGTRRVTPYAVLRERALRVGDTNGALGSSLPRNKWRRTASIGAADRFVAPESAARALYPRWYLVAINHGNPIQHGRRGAVLCDLSRSVHPSLVIFFCHLSADLISGVRSRSCG